MVRFQVFTIQSGDARTPRTISVIPQFRTGVSFGQIADGSFGSRSQAQAFVRKERLNIAGRETSVGVREVPTAARQAAKLKFKGAEVFGPPKSGRGRKLQARRLQLEKITGKVQVTAGKIDLSKLTSGERARVKQITGVNADKAFTIQAPIQTATTRAQFQRSLLTKRRVVALSTKIESKRLATIRPVKLKTLKTRPETARLFRSSTRLAGITPITPELAKTRIEQFEQKAKAQAERQRQFLSSPGFERIEKVAGRITFGRGVPIEERGFAGATTQALLRDFLGFPIALGGAAAGAVEKAKLTAEALTIPEIDKRRIGREVFVGAPRRVVTEFKALPPPEKVATGIFVLAAPFLGGGAVRTLVTRRATRAKAISELTVIERGKLERFELSIKELKGVRVEPQRLNLQEVERLNPQAAKAVDRVILRNKEDIVVGGSVAQRTQIKGKSRIPEDIDIFTRGDKDVLLKQLFTELTKSGVQRVSIVRGKQITIEGKKAIEVKELSLLEANIKKVQLPFQRVSSAFVKTPRGVSVLRLGAQAQRKVVGGFGLEQQRIRTKDVSDLPTILSQLRRSKAGSALLVPQRKIIPPRLVKPIGLLREAPSQEIVRRGEPSGLRGVSSFLGPALTTPPSVFPKASTAAPSILKPTRTQPLSVLITPSEIPPSVLAPPSVLRPQVVQPPSVLRPQVVQPPSVLPPTKAIPSVIEPGRPQPTISKRPPLGFSKKRVKELEKPAFKTEVRLGEKKGDKFVEVSQQTLPRKKALNRGFSIADQTTSRTVRIVRSGKTTIRDDPEIKLLNKFRGRIGKSKLPPKVFVEKTPFLIDQTGERLGIPFNPIRVPKLREALARKRTGRIMEVMQKVKKKKDTGILRRTSTVPIQIGLMRVVRPDKKPKRGRVNLVNKVTGRILFANGRGNIPIVRKVKRENLLRLL